MQLERKELDPRITFNEWVMVRLLESEYLENLIKRESAGDKIAAGGGEAEDLLTALYQAILSRDRRGNLELVEAVCNKIVQRSLERKAISSATRLQPDVKDMVLTGNVLQKTYGMRLLTALLAMEDSNRLLESDILPVKLAMAIVRDSKCTQLLIAALEFLRTAYKNLTNLKPDQPASGGNSNQPRKVFFNPLWDATFLDILVSMLELRVSSLARHHPRILGEVSMLVLLLCAEKTVTQPNTGRRAKPKQFVEPRPHLIRKGVVGALMRIVSVCVTTLTCKPLSALRPSRPVRASICARRNIATTPRSSTRSLVPWPCCSGMVEMVRHAVSLPEIVFGQ